MNEIQIFNNKDFGSVTTLEKDGEPWFVAKDISEILGYSETSKMINRLDDDEKMKIAPTVLGDANSMARYYTIINESGLYEAIFGSKMPQAKAFKKWIKTEVLPAIRKTGSYSTKSFKQLQKEMPSRSKIASDLQANLKIAKTFGLEGNQALLSANKMTVDQYGQFGVNPMLECGVELVNEEKEQFFTPTQIGNHINTSAREINKILTDLGFQEIIMDQKKRISYVVTDTGKPFCQLVDTGKKHADGSPVTQVKWSMDVLNHLEPVNGTVN